MRKVPKSGGVKPQSGDPQTKRAKAEAANEHRPPENDSLLALRGTGKALWADEHADEYVRRLRDDCD